MEHVRVTKCGLSVDGSLYDFLADEVLPGSGVEPETFWEGFARLVADFGPRNRDLLIERDRIQASIDEWHRGRAGDHDAVAYRELLERIGYLVPQGPPFEITTTDVDPEVALVAGPQLVVPLQNPRYALNAANARWGSLYDAVYGTDVLGDRPAPGPYDPIRGGRVIGWVRALLDQMIPLAEGSHSDSTGYAVDGACLRVRLAGGGATGLVEPDAFVGFRGPAAAPTSVLFRHHGLHIELRIDRADPVGSGDPAGISDVVLESAVTVIMDCEDSVAAVDAVDKVGIYRNWLGLMRGDLVAEVPSPGCAVIRRLAPDRTYQRPDGVRFDLPGRAVMFVRNVGHLMTTDAVLDRDGRDVPEGLLDAVVTVLAALHDLNKRRPLNSRTAAIYVVKPKMHGPAEVAFADALFARVEALFGLAAGTVKLGLMDEERRTSVNLAECIRAVAHRVAFINTGFLDRTGDEIHTSMHAGPMIPKTTMKMAPWLAAYEARNVAVGLACGFRGRAQIGKGMWTAPDLMAAMLAEKSAHPLAGASCAWVPSPTAATLHALHYHQVDVSVRQRELSRAPIPDVDDLLQLPLLSPGGVTVGERAAEIDNNAQGILGYVVRWVDQGVGCSKVPDIRDVALMEDRATCRISSQHLANWVRHGLVGADEVLAAMRRMAAVVDRQNAHDPLYHPMAPAFDGPAFRAACELVLAGSVQPCGYTEPILHAHRREAKSRPLAPGRAS